MCVYGDACELGVHVSCRAHSGLPQLLFCKYVGVGYVALKRPNEAETVAYRLTVCNSLLSTYSLNGVCACVCV